MDASTASDLDTNEDLTVQSTNDNIRVESVPTCVAWHGSSGQNRYISDVNLVLVYDAATKKALVRLQATTRLKKGFAKPYIYLFVKPDQICTLACISTEEELGHEKELHQVAREKLNTSTHVLRFELRSPPTFVVPNEYPYKFFRASSQVAWRSWIAFAKDTRCFFLHIPASSLSKARLVSFCRAVSSGGTLTSLDDNIASLYGGKSGKVVDPHADVDDDDAAQAEASIGVSSIENNAPPTYEERGASGPAASAMMPPLCLSPSHDLPRCRKRRRGESNRTDTEDSIIYERGNKIDDRILHAIFSLQRTLDEPSAAHGTSVSKILVKIEEIEGRFKQLEECQRNLADEVRTCMTPLWEELDGRLQSQEDREYVYTRDVIEEVVDENIKDMMAEAVDTYFRNDDEGQGLIREVVGEMIHEETRDILQSHRFTGNFTVCPEPSPI